MRPQEEAIVSAFIVPERQARYRALLGDRKHRRKALARLWHCGDLDEGCATTIRGRVDVAALLRKAGCPEQVYLMSACQELDGRELRLDQAIQEIEMVGGTILLGIAGRLGYYHGEDGERRAILERK